MKIKENINKNLKFSFSLATRDAVETEIKLLIHQSLNLFTTFPQKIVKDNRDIFSNFIIVVLIQECRPHGFLPP